MRSPVPSRLLATSAVRGLRDSLLPLQRTLSDKLDAAMNDPLVRALEDGSGRFDCGG